MTRERLQKHLARAGHGSRRGCEDLIAAGRVKVNGEVVDRPGHLVDPDRDEVFVDDRPVRAQRALYYLLNKPKGVVCSNRAQGTAPRAIDLVATPAGERLFCVGRLDEDSHGAILLTNDGDFANRVAHPRYGVEKTYRVTVKGRADKEKLARIREGMHLAEGRTAPARVHVVKRSRDLSVLRVTLREGRNRHIRRVFARVGLPVKDLARLQIGPIPLGALKPGSYRPLTSDEVAAVLDRTRQPTTPPNRRKRRARR